MDTERKEESKQSTKITYQITKEEGKKTTTKQPGNDQQNLLSTYLSIIELL